MINFRKLRWKNFLSFGNQFTEIQLDGSPTNLIIGSNGVGKSTFLDALTFVLYGKAFRKINKPQLINSINTSGALVEIEFDIGGHQYLIKRGIKPNVFEIYEDGDLLEQDAKMGDYQRQLEELIIKMNYTAFTQIVVLGKAVYTPFMRLSTPKRTELIEELLGISVFSEMQIDVKDRLKHLNMQTMASMDDIVLNQDRKSVKLDYIKVLSEDKSGRLIEMQSEIESHTETISGLVESMVKLNEDMQVKQSQQSSYDGLDAEGKTYTKLKVEFNQRIKSLTKDIDFFEKNDTCPVCTQHIEDEFKQNEIDRKSTRLTKISNHQEQLVDKIKEYDVNVSERNDINTYISSIQREQVTAKAQIDGLRTLTQKITFKMDKLNTENGNVAEIQKDVDALNKEHKSLSENMNKLREELTYYNEINKLLQDGGVKSLIIKKYLPIFNQIINNYLNKMGIFVSFNLDENFNETILSRNHDKFSYNSFSEGEKLRIDLAILLAWRDISRMKSAKDTNLIIMDEIFDSSLDQSGVDAFVDILPSMKGVNIFVISHTPDKLIDKFKNVINIKKNGNFSEITTTVVN